MTSLEKSSQSIHCPVSCCFSRIAIAINFTLYYIQASPLMTLIFSESPVSLIQLLADDTMENPKNGSEAASEEKFDTLELRNRTVTETLSPVEDLGQDKKEKVTIWDLPSK